MWQGYVLNVIENIFLSKSKNYTATLKILTALQISTTLHFE